MERKDYYITGELMESYEVKWPSKETIRHGKSVTYMPDGTIIFMGEYWNNMLHGLCKDFYKNGQLKYYVKYDKGHLLEVYEYYDINKNKLDYGYIKNGNGHLKKYNKNGKLREEGNVVNGFREGEWKIYNNMGLSHVVFYKKGIEKGDTYITNTF
ncbi:MAG: hypothetical protein GXO89_13525 [Chlorobi bacterium]|nr:hypothetical protein [Chlorobiota bacterium]